TTGAGGAAPSSAPNNMTASSGAGGAFTPSQMMGTGGSNSAPMMGSSSGGMAAMIEDAGPSRGPTPPRDGAHFPFPQSRESMGCSYPSSYRNEAVQAAYDEFKKDTVTADGAGGHLRVKRPNEPGLEPDSTVSEGIAYGMLMAVYMNDQHV